MLFNGFYLRRGYTPLLAKVKKRHDRETTIVPPQMENLKYDFAHLMMRDEIKDVCITGSLIVAEASMPPKDIDVVVVVKDLDRFLDNYNEITSLIPKKINGIVVDAFFHLHPSSFFISVGLYSDIMYQSVSKSEARPGPGIVKVVHPENMGWYDEALSKTFDLWERNMDNEFSPEFRDLLLAGAAALVKEPEKDGLGDKVAKAIKFVSKGKIKECGKCKKRRELLNKIGGKK